jgi:hypothetical protein
MGVFNGYLDKYYLDSWKVWFSVFLVFNVLGNIALAVQRYRIGTRTFLGAFGKTLKWLPLLTIFFGGLSLHVSQALLSHMFEIDMSWVSSCFAMVNTCFTESGADHLIGCHLQGG